MQTHAVQMPEAGCYCSGLTLEAAAWNSAAGCLQQPPPGATFTHLPVMKFEPVTNFKPAAQLYKCPLYRSTQRAGVLNSTGQSTNHVMDMHLPVAEGSQPQSWMVQGAAAFCTNRS